MTSQQQLAEHKPKKETISLDGRKCSYTLKNNILLTKGFVGNTGQ